MNYKLEDFETIKLKEMDKVKLMNRKECKFTVHYTTLYSILDRIKDDYYILDIEGLKEMPYESVYYDMPDFSLYRTHQNGKLNRYKVRERTYTLTGKKFLELKFKNNKKRTIKERIELFDNSGLIGNEEFLESKLPFNSSALEEKIMVKYHRITLVDKSMKERVTIDFNLGYSSAKGTTSHENLAIIEIKYEGNCRESIIDGVLKDKRIKPLSISKYCLGISQHYSMVKKNSINIKIRQINKVLQSANPGIETNTGFKKVS